MGRAEMICDCEVIHGDIVEHARQHMPSDEQIFAIGDFFKVFSDSTRVRILWALDRREMCVGDISVLLNMTKSAVSHQLKVLRENRLVKVRREGKAAYYSLTDEHVSLIFEMAAEHLEEKQEISMEDQNEKDL